MAFDFLQNLIGSVLLLVLNVDHRIDEMFSLEYAEAIFPAKAREKSAVVKGGLRVEIEFRGPPGRGAILEFHPKSMEVACASLRAERRKIFDIQIPRLFEVVIVGHDIRTFLGVGT